MSDNEQEPAGLEGLPPLYSISKGEVVSVQTYGAFVRLPGYKKEGEWDTGKCWLHVLNGFRAINTFLKNIWRSEVPKGECRLVEMTHAAVMTGGKLEIDHFIWENDLETVNVVYDAWFQQLLRFQDRDWVL